MYHLATDWKTYFGPGGAGIGAAARIWEGGLGIWGAVALGGVGSLDWLSSQGIPLPAFADAIAPGIVLAQAIGRLGNSLQTRNCMAARPLFRGVWRSSIAEIRREGRRPFSRWSVDRPSGCRGAPDVPLRTALELAGFAILIWVDRKFRLGHGRLFALYVALWRWPVLGRADA